MRGGPVAAFIDDKSISILGRAILAKKAVKSVPVRLFIRRLVAVQMKLNRIKELVRIQNTDG